jgi:hypothetical protein
MKRKPAPRKHKAKTLPEVPLESVVEDEGGDRIVSRPDGYHWLALDGHNEFGPFATLEAARADMLAAETEGLPEPAESLLEAEDEIGIADWIDPETGEPAEGHSPPHLEQE